MSSEFPRCRLCGYNLKSASGCAVCLDAKANLIWPVVEDAESDLSASSVINTTLRALRSRLRRLNRELTAEQAYNPALTKDLSAIGRTLKELAAEQRKLEDRESDHYGKLGIEGRMALFIDQFFSKLPEDFQVKLLTGMQKLMDEQNAPMLLEEENE